MPPHWSPSFMVLPMLLAWHYMTQLSLITAPVLLTRYFVTPVVIKWSSTSATDLRQRFLLSGVFLPFIPSCLTFHHADLRNIHPAGLFVWFTALHKRLICGRFYLRLRVGQSGDIKFHGELILPNIHFEIFTSYGIWILFAIGEHVTRLLS